jgi:hypothetical protein
MKTSVGNYFQKFLVVRVIEILAVYFRLLFLMTVNHTAFFALYGQDRGMLAANLLFTFLTKKSQKKGEKVKYASRFSPSRLPLSEGRSKKMKNIATTRRYRIDVK